MDIILIILMLLIYLIVEEKDNIEDIPGVLLIQTISRLVVAIHPILLLFNTWIVFTKLEIQTIAIY